MFYKDYYIFNWVWIRGNTKEKMRISLSKAACMSQLLMLVSTGYRHWISGEMHYLKAEGFARKMSNLYPIDATADQRGWAKKTAKYSATLIMYPHEKDSTRILYWLLATPGAPPKGFVSIHDREKLKDATVHPLPWRDQYQCLLSSKKGNAKPSWTWSMDPAYFVGIKASGENAANAGSDALTSLFGRLGHMPMFSGIRGQLKEIEQYSIGTWKKRRKSLCPALLPDPLPTMPKIKVWGDQTLEILVKIMAVAEQKTNEIGEVQSLQILSSESTRGPL